MKIAIANEKGGVGKTTTAVNLAAGLALKLSQVEGTRGRVLLIDMDPQGHALLATAFNTPALRGGVPGLAELLVESPPPSIQPMITVSEYHTNLFVLPANRPALTAAGKSLPALMAYETRLAKAIQAVDDQFAYIIIDTPPASGALLINSLVAADKVIIPVETSYLGVSGLRELQKTIEQVRMYFKPQLEILGYLPSICEESRSEAKEILVELEKRYPGKILPAIHKASDLAYAHSSHSDVFIYKPPRNRTIENISSSSRATKEYERLTEVIMDHSKKRK